MRGGFKGNVMCFVDRKKERMFKRHTREEKGKFGGLCVEVIMEDVL